MNKLKELLPEKFQGYFYWILTGLFILITLFIRFFTPSDTFKFLSKVLFAYTHEEECLNDGINFIDFTVTDSDGAPITKNLQLLGSINGKKRLIDKGKLILPFTYRKSTEAYTLYVYVNNKQQKLRSISLDKCQFESDCAYCFYDPADPIIIREPILTAINGHNPIELVIEDTQDDGGSDSTKIEGINISDSSQQVAKTFEEDVDKIDDNGNSQPVSNHQAPISSDSTGFNSENTNLNDSNSSAPKEANDSNEPKPIPTLSKKLEFPESTDPKDLYEYLTEQLESHKNDRNSNDIKFLQNQLERHNQDLQNGNIDAAYFKKVLGITLRELNSILDDEK